MSVSYADGPDPTPTRKVCHRCADDVILGGSDPVVHILYFHDRLCEECVVVDEHVLAPLKDAHGIQLNVDRRDVEGSQENYTLLRTLEDEHGVSHAEMPVLFIGEHCLTGEQEIRQRLPSLVDHYLALGGAPPPDTPPTPTPPAEADPQASAIHVLHVYQPGCQACDRLVLELDHLQQRYPQLVIHSINVREDAALCEWLGQRAGVPESERLTAPAVFVANDALVGEDITSDRLEDLIVRHAATGADPVWEAEGQLSPAVARRRAASSILARFRSFTMATIVVAGLVDGLNPCAFATLVFFVSYLAVTGRQGREVLWGGSAFTLGVFLTYLGIGLGALEILASLPVLAGANRWIYASTAALCLLLAAGSIYDWWQTRRNGADAIRLRMPTRLRGWVNRVIRRGMGARAFVPVTFVTGAAVSVIELACTGQVYLPTILFVLGVPEMELRARLYLVLYNAMFVLPLVVVFVLVYLGTTSRQLTRLIQRHTGKVKLATAALFLSLAAWMTISLL